MPSCPVAAFQTCEKKILLDFSFLIAYDFLTVGKSLPDLSLFLSPTYQPEVDAYVYRR